jgi:hypothetical protein
VICQIQNNGKRHSPDPPFLLSGNGGSFGNRAAEQPVAADGVPPPLNRGGGQRIEWPVEGVIVNANTKTTETNDRKTVLSTLWVFVVLNYLYGDLAMMIFHPAAYGRIAARMTEGVVLGAAALMELSIAMVLLSRVLKYAVNRWANIIVGVVFSAFAVMTLLSGKAPAFYVFLSAVEIASTLFIVWYAWTWPNPVDKKSE